jgi:hypothetical protein
MRASARRKLRKPDASFGCPRRKNSFVESIRFYLSTPVCKNIPLLARPKSLAYRSRPASLEGRIAIVTDARWDAVDVDGALTNALEADGEDVWS